MNKKPLRVLLVEDNAGDALLLREMFSKESRGSFEVSRLTRMADAEALLAKGEVDMFCWIWDCRMGMVSTPCAGHGWRLKYEITSTTVAYRENPNHGSKENSGCG
jgi:hypothetical protein